MLFCSCLPSPGGSGLPVGFGPFLARGFGADSGPDPTETLSPECSVAVGLGGGSLSIRGVWGAGAPQWYETALGLKGPFGGPIRTRFGGHGVGAPRIKRPQAVTLLAACAQLLKLAAQAGTSSIRPSLAGMRCIAVVVLAIAAIAVAAGMRQSWRQLRRLQGPSLASTGTLF